MHVAAVYSFSQLCSTLLAYNCIVSCRRGLSFLLGRDVIRFSNVESTLPSWDKPFLKMLDSIS